MSGAPESTGAAARLRRLLPPGQPTTVDDFVAGLAPPALSLNMIATADGRASLEGRTASLGNRADRELFHALRAISDAVLVGASTVRRERYGRIIRDPDVRARRLRAGRTEEPLAVIVSQSLHLSPELPLLATPGARVVVLTGGDGEVPPCRASVEYIREPGDGGVDLTRALARLRERFAVDAVLCEGGPRLNADLLEAGLVDELFLSVSPKLAGGADALRIVHGAELAPPRELELISALESDSHLFLRYALTSP